MTRHLAAGALLCALLTSCGGGTEPSDIDVGTIVVAPNPIVVMQQQTAQLAVSVLDPAGALLTGVPVTFTSGDPAVITVSNVGLVTSVGPAGQTSVSVKAGNKSQAVPVTVAATSNSIVLGPQESQLAQLGTMQLEPVLLDLAGNPVAGAEFTYETTDAQIATVDVNGLLTSHGKAGLVTITARSDDIVGVKAISITQVPTAIAVPSSSITLVRDGSTDLHAAVVDAVGDPIAGAALAYSASPASLLSVSSSGRLTAADQTGSGSVTVTSGALTALIDVAVIEVGSLVGMLDGSVSVTGVPYGIAVAGQDTWYAVGTSGTFHVGEVFGTGVTNHSISSTLTIGVAYNPVRDEVYVGGYGTDGLMDVDRATKAVVRRWNAGTDQILDVVVSPDGQTIIAAGSNGTVYKISTATFQQVTSFQLPTSVVHLLHHPSQSVVYASGVGQAVELNTSSGASRAFAVNQFAQASALAFAGDRLYVGAEADAIEVVDLASGNVVSYPLPGCGVYDVAAKPGGAQLLVSCSLNGAILLVDSETLAVISTMTPNGGPRRIAIALSGDRAVVANEGGWIDFVR